MGDKTGIEWADATWNIVTGCSVISPGCENCYAMRDAAGRLQDKPSYKGLTNRHGKWTGEVRFNEHLLDQPLRWRRPRRVFVNSMGDLFHEAVPEEWIDHVFAAMALADKHEFLVLTKRAARMREYMTSIEDGDKRIEGDWARDALIEGTAQKIWYERTGEDTSLTLAVHMPLPNVSLGVSVENQATADERIPLLLDTPAAMRFVSAEPLLGPIALVGCRPVGAGEKVIHWVIAGGESGKDARPMHPQWARNLRDVCTETGTAFFFKQWGEWAPSHHWGHWLQAGADNRALIDLDGRDVDGHADMEWKDGSVAKMVRVGKSRAGRQLDGRMWDQYPASTRGRDHEN